ncbi:MAG: DUF3800 domain-containing protein [bacterium]|nr:DUF3800 domain-containing protein [bacterium]
MNLGTDNSEQLPLFGKNTYDTDKSLEAIDLSSDFSKYIVYVDESGDHSLTSIDQQYPIFVLAFCVFHKKHYSEYIVPELEKFKFNNFGHDQIILHENEIRKEKGPFNTFKNRAEKNYFIQGLTNLISRSNFILISCTIDKRKIKGKIENNDNPYHIALGFCMETLWQFLEEKKETTKKTHLVFEQRGKKEDRDLELEFRRICDGKNKLDLEFPFEVIFADKKAMSTGLQFADLVARPIGLKTLRPDQENRSFEILKSKFFCEGGRKKTGKDYLGYGMKIWPEE